MGTGYNADMRILSRRTLREFWTNHADAETALRAWYADAEKAEWTTPEDIKDTYANASILGNNRVVFNIRGNTYRLVVAINYAFGIVYIRFIGTHAEYDKIDAETI
jgi:mRNA interferase HigB